MAAFNVVRFRVKPGREHKFLMMLKRMVLINTMKGTPRAITVPRCAPESRYKFLAYIIVLSIYGLLPWIDRIFDSSN